MCSISHVGAASSGSKLLSIKAAAEHLDVSVSKLYQLLRSGRLSSLWIDGSRKVSLAAIERFVREQEAAAEAERNGELPS